MEFLGLYDHTIDDKGRLAIPARFRADLSDGLYLTAGVDRCLQILTSQTWQAEVEAIRQLPQLHAAARQAQRNLFAMATHLVPDKLGRIVVPQNLRSYAGLGNDVVIAGVYDRVEIWDREAWSQVRQDFVENGVEQIQQLSELLPRPVRGS
jgi:MraZ protein